MGNSVVFNLQIWAAGHGSGIALTEDEYSAIIIAMKRVYSARDMEEKLDLLLENFREYEQELLSLALKYSLVPPLDDERVAVERQLLNRRVINLLSSARMYIDQMKHSISQLRLKDPAPDPAALFSAECDASLEYRIAEALRKLALHQALPVHIMNWPSEWEEIESEKKRLRFGIVASISVDELVAEGGFKASVLQELRESGKSEFSLTLVLRKYVESLASVHERIRTATRAEIDMEHTVILRAIERARGAFGRKLVGLVVSKGSDPEHVDEHHFVNEKSWLRRESLIRRHSHLGKLSRRYVAAEHPGDVA